MNATNKSTIPQAAAFLVFSSNNPKPSKISTIPETTLMASGKGKYGGISGR